MGFESLITSLLSNTIKSTQNFYYNVENIEKDLAVCDTVPKLKNIIKRKNQLSNVIDTTQKNIKSLNATTDTIEKILKGLDTVITIIKVLPVPTSVPPGVGVPTGVITTLSDTLSIAQDNVKSGKSNIKGAEESLNNINKILEDIKKRLSELDLKVLDNFNKVTVNLPEEQKIELQNELNIEISEGDEPEIINNLQNRGLGYKGYIIKIEPNPENKFSFPQRRAVGSNIRNVYDKIYGEYSYSSDTKILVEELKFLIDSKNRKY